MEIRLSWSDLAKSVPTVKSVAFFLTVWQYRLKGKNKNATDFTNGTDSKRCMALKHLLFNQSGQINRSNCEIRRNAAGSGFHAPKLIREGV
jgi:hypothetical protein